MFISLDECLKIRKYTSQYPNYVRDFIATCTSWVLVNN